MVENGIEGATRITDANGQATFCDAPLHRVDLVIGTLDCGVVLVKGIKSTWPETRNVFVTYDQGHCGGEVVFPSSCEVLLRIHDEEGRPLAGAEFDYGSSQRDASDAFGRIFRSVKPGKAVEGVLKKEGRQPVRVSEDAFGAMNGTSN
jgi:hypothetical protein